MTANLRTNVQTMDDVRRALQFIQPLLPSILGAVPGASDDESKGYKVGSHVTVDAGVADALKGTYRCFKNDINGAEWHKVVDVQLDLGGQSDPSGGETPDLITDEQVTRFDGTAGRIQGSPVHINDAGEMTDVTIPAYLPVAFRDFHNGTFREKCNALITEDGGVVTLTITNAGGGDLIMQFNDGSTTLSTPATLDSGSAPPNGLSLGTDEAATMNYVYIPFSTKALTVSTSGYPTDAEHIKITTLELASAVYTASHGARINHNINNELMDANSYGHLPHMGDRIRADGARYVSGVDWTFTGDGGSVVTLILTAGIVFQMHRHVYGAKNTAGSDIIHVVNDPDTDYKEISDINTANTDSLGVSMSNKYWNAFFFGVANKSGEFSPVMMKLPNKSYVKLSDAEHDTLNGDDLTIPTQYTIKSSTGFPIMRVTFKHSTGGNTLTVQSVLDLRAPQGTSGGGGAAVSPLVEFSDALFKVFNDTDPTRLITLDAASIGTGQTRVLTMPDTDITLVKNNVSNSAPTVNNDNTEGYARGSHWVRSTTGQLWVATNVSTGNATWSPVAFGFNAYNQAADPTVSNDNTQGFHAGSVWTNTTASPDRVFILKDPATGDADWIEIVDGGTSLPVDDATSIVTSGTDKEMRIDVGTVADSTVRVLTMPNANVDLGALTNSNIDAAAAIALTKLATGTNRQLIGVNGTPANKMHTRLISHVAEFDIPVEGDRRVLGRIGSASTMFEIHGSTNAGTVVFNVQIVTRAQLQANEGTNILTSDQSATFGSGAVFDVADMDNDGALAGDRYLVVVLGVVTSATKCWISSDHEIDVPA